MLTESGSCLFGGCMYIVDSLVGVIRVLLFCVCNQYVVVLCV